MFIDNVQDIPPPQADFSAPPPYDVAANSKLPTYEEVQREKQMEGEGNPQVMLNYNLLLILQCNTNKYPNNTHKHN